MDDNDGEEKDDVKRKSRNLSEKKRRDQFNLLIGELSGMVTSNARKMDKSNVLKATIAFFRNHKEAGTKVQSTQVRETWQPSFLSNEEFTHLMLEALDGFIMTISCSGNIIYASDSITPLLGHLPLNISGTPLWSLMPAEEQEELQRFLSNPALAPNPSPHGEPRDRYTIMIHLQKGGLFKCDDSVHERVHLTGYFERYNCPSEDGLLEFECSDGEDTASVGKPSKSHMTQSSFSTVANSVMSISAVAENTKTVFVAVGRLEQPHLLREMLVMENSKTEFTSRHSLEWKFLFLDHRAPTVIGYLPFEVLGTSGFDYYHVDDLEKVAACHDLLIKTGKGTSCHYRFLTKGQQWIWLQTQYYITYHQWNSKPEFIVCTNTVVSYGNVLKKRTRNSSGRREASKDGYQTYTPSEDPTMHHTPIKDNPPSSCGKPLELCTDSSIDPKHDSQRMSIMKLKALSPVSVCSDSTHQTDDEPRKSFTELSKPSKHFSRSPNGNHFKESSSKRVKMYHPCKGSDVESQNSHDAGPVDQNYMNSPSLSGLPYEYHDWGTKSTHSSSRYNQTRSSRDRTAVDSSELFHASGPIPFNADRSSKSYLGHPDKYSCLASPGSDVSNHSLASLQGASVASQEIASPMADRFHMYRKHEPSTTYNEDLHNPTDVKIYICSPPGETRAVSKSKSDLLNHPSVDKSQTSPTTDQPRLCENAQQNCSSSLDVPYIDVNCQSPAAHISNSYPTQVSQPTVPFCSVIPVSSSASSHVISNSPASNEHTNQEDLHQPLYLTQEQQQLQAQLRQKHAELQDQIIKQQEELRMVNQQLVMSQYGMNVPVQKTALPYARETSSVISYASDSENGCSTTNGAAAPNCEVYYGGAAVDAQQYLGYCYPNEAVPPASENIQCTNVYITQAVGAVGVTNPYQLPQQQAQMLFNQPDHLNSEMQDNPHSEASHTLQDK